MALPRRLFTTPLWSLAIAGVASGLGLTVNATRTTRLPWIAPFPYQQTCVEKSIPERSRTMLLTSTEAVRRQGRQDVLFLDSRPSEDFAEGHIADARSFPYSFVTPPTASIAAELRRYAELVVYCDSPQDRLAGMLAEQLRHLGLRQVRVLRGGLDAYREAETAAGGGHR